MLPPDAATVCGFAPSLHMSQVLNVNRLGGRAPVLWAKAKSAQRSNTIGARAGSEGFQEFFNDYLGVQA